MIMTPIVRRILISAIKQTVLSQLIPIRLNYQTGARLTPDEVTPFDVEEECSRNSDLRDVLINANTFGYKLEDGVVPMLVDTGHGFRPGLILPYQWGYYSENRLGMKIYRTIFHGGDTYQLGISFRDRYVLLDMSNHGAIVGRSLRDHLDLHPGLLETAIHNLCVKIGDDPVKPVAQRVSEALRHDDSPRQWIVLDTYSGPEHRSQWVVTDSTQDTVA